MIEETCKCNGLEFSRQVSILSELKSVRILGVKKKKKKNAVSSEEPKKLSYIEKVLQNSNVICVEQKPL
ncbi:hypothetical protein BDF21DRAFT_483375 [Thamnidium elegans]|nr:hypothetical protein BDF21DRAFT_483375 [Thamnidium elegans]